MPIVTWHEDALLAMESVGAAEVLAAWKDVVHQHFPARKIELLMVDYRFSMLQRVADPFGGRDERTALVPVDGSAAGRTLASQQTSVSPPDDTGVPVRLPVTVRGDRLGVLEVWLTTPPNDAEQHELRRLATALGYALIVASRDTDLFERASRTQRLSLASEIQWQLLPSRGCAGEHFILAGQLEPAYHVAGDNFDWCAASDHLLVTVSEGMGRGTSASLLTSLAVNALRNARRGGLDLAAQARLANEAIHAPYGGQQFVGTLLLRLDYASGQATAVDAGSPLVIRQRGTEVEVVQLDKQLPLGMFEGTNYVEEELDVASGDRLIIVSDGFHAARSPRNEEFKEAKLERSVRATRGLPAGEVVRQFIRELHAHHEGQELSDDAVVVCLDWTGTPPP
jgi:serine phosphatase RsbU (regulator of sigma subunit)